jgi:hypothetical protein
MGYDLHLLKPDGTFTESEYEALRAADPELDALYFSDGQITLKNPSEQQVEAMVAAARGRGWAVEGDDGERYGEEGPARPEPPWRESWGEALARWLRSLRQPTPTCPFKVGDKVSMLYRTGGIVIEVDPRGNHGAGRITVRFPDGAEFGGMFEGHAFERED